MEYSLLKDHLDLRIRTLEEELDRLVARSLDTDDKWLVKSVLDHANITSGRLAELRELRAFLKEHNTWSRGVYHEDR